MTLTFDIRLVGEISGPLRAWLGTNEFPSTSAVAFLLGEYCIATIAVKA